MFNTVTSLHHLEVSGNPTHLYFVMNSNSMSPSDLKSYIYPTNKIHLNIACSLTIQFTDLKCNWLAIYHFARLFTFKHFSQPMCCFRNPQDSSTPWQYFQKFISHNKNHGFFYVGVFSPENSYGQLYGDYLEYKSMDS